MDREQAAGIAADYARRVKADCEFVSPNDIILFGSYVKGGADVDSDIDIAVVFDKFDGDYWGAVQRLHELTISVDTRIEPVLLEDSNDPSGFVKTVRREGLKVS
jgi:predicted nucleotidyltransferase